MKPEEAEHRQLEAESLVEAARERGDAELLREARDTLKRIENAALDEYESRGLLHMIAIQAQATITKLEQRLLNE